MGEDLNLKELSYESAMGKLEKICDDLQSGKLDLEGAVSAFELGTKLRKHAKSKLVSAKLRVEIVGEDAKHLETSETISGLSNSLSEAVYEHYLNGDLESAQKSIQLYQEKIGQIFANDKGAGKKKKAEAA